MRMTKAQPEKPQAGCSLLDWQFEMQRGQTLQSQCSAKAKSYVAVQLLPWGHQGLGSGFGVRASTSIIREVLGYW